MSNIGYLFISNSSKPSSEVLSSTDSIGTNSFSEAAIWAADAMNWELHMGINRNHPNQVQSKEYDIKFYDQHTYRSMFAIRDNFKAYKNLKQYIKDNPQIDIIHCNTPIGGVMGRLIGHKFHKKVIYTAHGFHFYKGAPLFNRTVIKWIEMWLAHYTDILITINQEDFEASKKFKLKKGGNCIQVQGVGIKLSDYIPPKTRTEVRSSLSLKDNDFVCICMGDIIKRKNYTSSIKAIAKLEDKNVHYLICGTGSETENLKELSNNIGLQNQIHFLGFRNDIKDLLFASDCFLFSSLQEGLPRSTMEAMASGLPCIVSDIRGNRDLIENNKGGILVKPTDSNGFANAIKTIKANPSMAHAMSEWNLNRIKDFDINIVKQQLLNIFKKL